MEFPLQKTWLDSSTQKISFQQFTQKDVSGCILKTTIRFYIFIRNLADGVQNGLTTFMNDTKLNRDMLGTGLKFKRSEKI